MEIKYEIADKKVRNFTDDAKRSLCEQSQKYTLEIIKEADNVEKLIREGGASSEITENTVLQAVRRNKTAKKKNIAIIIMRVISEILLLVAGGMFLPEKFITTEGVLNQGYFIAFLVVTIVAIIATIVTYFVGGD